MSVFDELNRYLEAASSESDCSDPELEPEDCEIFESENDSEEYDSNYSDEETECKDYVGKDGQYQWRANPPQKVGPIAKKDLKIHLPQPAGPLKKQTNAEPIVIWNTLTKGLTDIIIKNTNTYLHQRRELMKEKDNAESTFYMYDLDEIELNAYFGLLLLTSIHKCNNENVNSLFATDGTGRDIYRATMPQKRFKILMESLRFDDKSTRSDRKRFDKSAAIADFVDQLNKNFQESFSPGDVLCVDETLIGFRGNFLLLYRVLGPTDKDFFCFYRKMRIQSLYAFETK